MGERKAWAIVSLFILLATLMSGNFRFVNAPPDETCYYALIICHTTFEAYFMGDAAYMYHTLRFHYAFDKIYYLHDLTDREGVNASATKDNVRLAINTTLANWSDENDVVFIFFTDHGAGYSHSGNVISSFARVDGSMGDSLDEGNEIWNETSEEWIGVDECLCLSDGTYWDDEFKQDLNCLTYGRLVVAIMACYSGGFIDDLTGENRIIMTAANETCTGVTDIYQEEGGFDAGGGLVSDRYCEWTEALIDALHGEDTYYDPFTYAIVHKNVTIQADSDQDGHVSMLEAWQYAWDHDEGRIDGKETNWLDDNNNGLPTYINGNDSWSEPCDNGSLAATLWFPLRDYNLAILDVTSFKTSAGQDYTTSVNVTLINQGPETETLNVTAYANATAIGNQQTTLDPGDSAELTFTWNTTASAKGNYTISAYVTPISGEMTLEDNNVTDGWTLVTIAGDVDADRDVDIFDIVAISNAYGSEIGDSEYDPNCDIDSNYEVDIFDLVIAQGNYGKSW